MEDEQIEMIAAIMHEIWSNWAAHMLHCLNVVPYPTVNRLKDRWIALMNTPYERLGEHHKDICREDALKILEVVGSDMNPSRKVDIVKIDEVVQKLLNNLTLEKISELKRENRQLTYQLSKYEKGKL